MKISPFHNAPANTFNRGFTLIEMLVALAVGATLLTAVVSLTIFTSKTFCITGNYADLDAKSRNTIDVISKEIRNSSALIAVASANPFSLTFTNATAGTATTIIYDATARTLTMQKTGQATRTYLTECDRWNYSLYNRAPYMTNNNVVFYPTTDLKQVKLVNLSWTCSRKVLGSKLTTETVLTAQIVLRNKVQ